MSRGSAKTATTLLGALLVDFGAQSFVTPFPGSLPYCGFLFVWVVVSQGPIFGERVSMVDVSGLAISRGQRGYIVHA